MLFLSECFIGSGNSGIRIGFAPPKGYLAAIFPKAILGSQDMVSLSNHVPVWDAIDRAKPKLRPEVSKPRLQAQRALGQELQHEA